ncbi:MAG: Re/Si-specific NAD(P)(+) transhydrogenase subunit alpha [Burkholderiales bacterium]|nr:Re/Si-specific NAD(P)(+) transhydrogenase subunit alpha [Burkholderiales bacterium]
MKIGIPRETRPGETRVAATPETVKKYVAARHEVVVEAGAGAGAMIPDADYAAAGARLADAATVYAEAELLLKVRPPQAEEAARMKAGQVLVGTLNRFDTAGLETLARQGVTGFALEAAPRITRAQSLDVLSSQANLGGYMAVLIAATHYPRVMPMFMTAAGTVKAARVIVMGVGVAGLQAIATAKRLGAVVEATDVRPATKEQVESLGAKFIDVPFETDEERETAQGVGGYARPMPESWLKRQAALVAERIRQADIVITTALIPGRPAPVLVTEDMVKSMKSGSVIVDMAAGQGAASPSGATRGGNCPLTEEDRVVVRHGVTLIGHTNFPATVAADASALFARNVQDFLKLIIDKDGKLAINKEDEIVAACLLTENGQVVKKA